jgi:hypothetical protein
MAGITIIITACREPTGQSAIGTKHIKSERHFIYFVARVE